MKHVGLNVAADPWMTLAYIGVNAGLVLVCADDPGMHSSQNEQDNRYYAVMAKVPMLEPGDSQEAYDMAKAAFDLSEKFDTPVLLRTETRVCHSRSMVEYRDERVEVDLPYEKDYVKRVMVPGHARLRHPVLIERLEALREESERSPFNRVEMRSSRVGMVVSGVCYEYAREAFPEASILKLGFTHPLPEKLIHEFASHFHRLYVVEELEPYPGGAPQGHGHRRGGQGAHPPRRGARPRRGGPRPGRVHRDGHRGQGRRLDPARRARHCRSSRPTCRPARR